MEEVILLPSCEIFKASFVESPPLLRGIVRGLVMRVVKIPPTMAKEAKAVCGTKVPKTTVAPINGAPSRHRRAQQMVEKEHIFRFSALTNSTVQVVKMANVLDMAILDIMAVTISRATRPLTSTAR